MVEKERPDPGQEVPVIGESPFFSRRLSFTYGEDISESTPIGTPPYGKGVFRGLIGGGKGTGSVSEKTGPSHQRGLGHNLPF